MFFFSVGYDAQEFVIVNYRDIIVVKFQTVVIYKFLHNYNQFSFRK